MKARLGALETTWSRSGLRAAADGLLEVDLAPPPEAWMHPLSADYVTDLAVTLIGTNSEGRTVAVLPAPPAFLAWPVGLAGAPVVWDLAAMKERAPAGIVSPVVRAQQGDLTGVDRVGPPIDRTGPPRDDLVLAGEG